MKFINNKHSKNFDKLDKLFPGLQNREYKAILYLMAGNKELQLKMQRYLDKHKNMFQYTQMFRDETFSTEAKVLANLAVDIYRGGDSLRGTELFQLNNQNFDLAINAREYGINKNAV
jgi:hypothetical protein